MTAFVTTVPDVMETAAGELSSIRSALGEAATAAASSTTAMAPAAADEVSAAISQFFGSFGQEFQALNAQAAAFHDEFANLLNGGAAAYLNAEVANAQTVNPAASLLSTLTSGGGLGSILTSSGTSSGLGTLLGPGSSGGLGTLLSTVSSVGLLPIIGNGGLVSILGNGGLVSILGNGGLVSVIGNGGLLSILPTGQFLGFNFSSVGTGLGNILSTVAGGGTSSLLSGLLSNPIGTLDGLFPGLFPGSTTQTGTTPSGPNPWQVLFDTSGANLEALGADWNAHPFPLLHQFLINQAGYGQLVLQAFENGVQDFPGGLQVLPGQVEAAIASTSGFNPLAFAEWFGSRQGVYGQLLTTALADAGQGFQSTIPVFESDMGMAYQQIQEGNFNAAVPYIGKGLIDLFITGADTSHLGINITGFPNTLISGPIYLEGPVAALLPILSLPGLELQNFTDIMPAGSSVQHMAQNLTNLVNALTDTSISATGGLDINESNLLDSSFAFDANFGLPLALGFALIGSPITTLNGVATVASYLGYDIQTGNAEAFAGAIADAPAIILNQTLNGEVLVPLGLPVSESFFLGVDVPVIGPVGTSVGVNVPVVAYLPFDGLLVPPHAISATVPDAVLTIDGTDIVEIPLNLNLTLGGTEFGGLLPGLINTVPQNLAQAITPDS